MSRPYFEEVQRFRDNQWIWILLIVASLSALLPLLYGMYWQIDQGEPWGNEPMSDQGLILLFLFILVSLGVASFMIVNVKLELTIDERGVHYRFPPIKSKWQTITKGQISDFSLEKRFRIFESGGLGYHRNRLNKTRSMRISGGKHLALKLINGEKFLFGTQNLEGLESAMKKLMNNNEMSQWQ